MKGAVESKSRRLLGKAARTVPRGGAAALAAERKWTKTKDLRSERSGGLRAEMGSVLFGRSTELFDVRALRLCARQYTRFVRFELVIRPSAESPERRKHRASGSVTAERELGQIGPGARPRIYAAVAQSGRGCVIGNSLIHGIIEPILNGRAALRTARTACPSWRRQARPGR